MYKIILSVCHCKNSEKLANGKLYIYFSPPPQNIAETMKSLLTVNCKFDFWYTYSFFLASTEKVAVTKNKPATSENRA